MSHELAADASSGIFETMLVIGGAPVELEAHLDRISASAEELYGVPVPPDVGERVRAHARELDLGRVRVTLAPGADGELEVALRTAEVDAADVFPSWERAAKLGSVVVAGGLGRHKWADRGQLERLEAALGGGRLALIVDERTGEVLEASRANVFAIEGGMLLTPPTDGRILPGVARAGTLAAARSLGIEVREEPLVLERLISVGQVFLTGSVRGLEPVCAVDEATLEAPGPPFATLAEHLRRLWTSIVPPAPAGAH